MQLERCAHLDERLGHLEPSVERSLVQWRVAPRLPVGRGEVRTRGDERTRCGRVVGVARDIVELGVERTRGGRIAVRRCRAEAESSALSSAAAAATAAVAAAVTSIATPCVVDDLLREDELELIVWSLEGHSAVELSVLGVACSARPGPLGVGGPEGGAAAELVRLLMLRDEAGECASAVRRLVESEEVDAGSVVLRHRAATPLLDARWKPHSTDRVVCDFWRKPAPKALDQARGALAHACADCRASAADVAVQLDTAAAEVVRFALVEDTELAEGLAGVVDRPMLG
mmetsp:Transcript_39458/g.104134  ORF Transcript_39458/g.104134 Transcript_39458/m.104134 type:complete len:287 (-) Transcript_39458:2361-3221(-)